MLRIDIHAAHPNVTLRCSGRIVFGLELETLRCMATSRTENCLTLDLDVLQLSGRLAGDVKESRNDNPTRDLQMAADRTRPHTLCGPVVSSLFSFAARC
jgi:hypothetical protein